MDKLVPGVLFSLLGKVFHPARKALAVRMLNRLFRKNLGCNFRSAIGASIDHTNDFATSTSLFQFAKKSLFQQRMECFGNGLLLIPRKNSNRDQYRIRFFARLAISFCALALGLRGYLHARILGE